MVSIVEAKRASLCNACPFLCSIERTNKRQPSSLCLGCTHMHENHANGEICVFKRSWGSASHPCGFFFPRLRRPHALLSCMALRLRGQPLALLALQARLRSIQHVEAF